MYTDNFSAMATQAAVMAGFTTTCLIEISLPSTVNPLAKYFLHLAAIVSICANLTCVSLSTITSIWGSGKALRGQDGSMDEAVDGMSRERSLIFQAFAIGLGGNLCTVCSTCFILMDFPISLMAVCIVNYAAWTIGSNALRIQKKFDIADQAVRLDDLTKYPANIGLTSSSHGSRAYDHLEESVGFLHGQGLESSRYRKSVGEVV